MRLGTFFRVNRWLLVSLVALGAATFFTLRYVHRLEQISSTKPTVIPMTTIVVARTPISAMTPISVADLATESIPTPTAPSGAYTSLAALAGSWSQEAISAGVPVVANEVFLPKSANVLAARITPGDMATDVPLSAANAVDGLIEPGDKVSLFARIIEANKQSVVEDFLNRVSVLAVNGVMTPPVATTAPPTTGQSETLILALSPAQISTLIFMQEKGPITAVLDAAVGTTRVPLPYGMAQWQVPVR